MQNEKIIEEITWKRECFDRLYDLGFSLVGMPPFFKRPLTKWKRFQTERLPKGPLEWAYIGRNNLFLITGEVSGVIVVDTDDVAAEELVNKHCPETRMMVRSGSRRGFQRFYRHPGFRVRNHQGLCIGGEKYKIDIRGDGGGVASPGSTHTSQLQYEWIEPFTADMLESIPVYDPKWLPHDPRGCKDCPWIGRDDFDVDGLDDLNAIMQSDDLPCLDYREKQAIQYLKGTPGSQSGDGAQNACYRLCGKIALGFLVPRDRAVDLIMTHWAERPDQLGKDGNWEPWTEREIFHKVDSSITNSQSYVSHFGRLGDKLNGFDDVAYRLSKVISAASWVRCDANPGPDQEMSQDAQEQLKTPEPQKAPQEPIKPLETIKRDPLYSYLWEGFHQDLTEQDRARRIKSQDDVFRLIPSTGFFPTFIRAHLPRTDAPVIFHLAAALGVASVLLGRRCAIWEGDDKILPNLWILAVARSSDLRKSTVASEFEKIISSDPDFGRTLAGPKGTVEAYMEHWGWIFSKEDVLNKDTMEYYKQCMLYGKVDKGEIEPSEALEALAACRLADFRQRVQRCQVEGGNETKGICPIYTDELSSLLETLSHSNASGMMTDLIRAYDGFTAWEKRTRHSGLYVVPDPVSIIVSASTIEPLQPYLSSRDGKSGFLARFLFFRAESRDFLLPFRDSMSDEWKEKLGQELDLLKNCHGVLRYSRQALQFYVSWRKDFEKRIPHSLAAWKARYGTLVHKIALLFQASVGRGILGKEISLENTKLACAFVDEAIQHVCPILDQLPDSEAARDALKIIQALKDAPRQELTKNQLSREVRIGTERMKPAMETLELEERIQLTKVDAKGENGGRPRVLVRLLPD